MQCYTPYFDVHIQLRGRMKNSHPIPCMWGNQQARNHPEAPRRTGEASPTTNFGPWTVFGSSSLPGCPVPVTEWFRSFRTREEVLLPYSPRCHGGGPSGSHSPAGCRRCHAGTARSWSWAGHETMQQAIRPGPSRQP